MDLSLEIPQGHLFVRSINADGIRVQDEYYTGPFVLSTQQIVPTWPVGTISDIDEDKLQIIFELQPEVVLIGCGKTQKFLPPAIQMLFLRRNIGVEVMTTDAACRTFNVLASEGRNVVAALLPESIGAKSASNPPAQV